MLFLDCVEIVQILSRNQKYISRSKANNFTDTLIISLQHKETAYPYPEMNKEHSSPEIPYKVNYSRTTEMAQKAKHWFGDWSLNPQKPWNKSGGHGEPDYNSTMQRAGQGSLEQCGWPDSSLSSAELKDIALA